MLKLTRTHRHMPSLTALSILFLISMNLHAERTHVSTGKSASAAAQDTTTQAEDDAIEKYLNEPLNDDAQLQNTKSSRLEESSLNDEKVQAGTKSVEENTGTERTHDFSKTKRRLLSEGENVKHPHRTRSMVHAGFAPWYGMLFGTAAAGGTFAGLYFTRQEDFFATNDDGISGLGSDGRASMPIVALSTTFPGLGALLAPIIPTFTELETSGGRGRYWAGVLTGGLLFFVPGVTLTIVGYQRFKDTTNNWSRWDGFSEEEQKAMVRDGILTGAGVASSSFGTGLGVMVGGLVGMSKALNYEATLEE